MKFQSTPIIGKIIKRYKRFLVDIELESTEIITAHLANTGSMKTCWEPGWKALLSYSDDPKRKLKYSVEMIHNGQTWIGVNTSRANRIVEEALLNKEIESLESYKQIKREHKVGNSRIDFFLSDSIDLPDCYLEVKNVTLLGPSQTALFPDATTTRGQKHLEELIELKRAGMRTIIFFLIQREDVRSFSVADHIDEEYARLLVKAHKVGVEIFCYQCSLNQQEARIKSKIPFILPELSALSIEKTKCEDLASKWEFMPSFNPMNSKGSVIKIPKSKHLIFYGGSFNPWHDGHLQCLKMLEDDQHVYVIPDNNPRKKRLSTKGPWERYQELREKIPAHIQIYPGFWAKDKANPTVNWLPQIKERFNDVTLALLMGFDSFMSIDTWIEAQTLLSSLSTLYIVSRLDNQEQKQAQTRKLQKSFPNLELKFLGGHDFEEVSSTKLRKRRKRK